jgi:hypothetical protein
MSVGPPDFTLVPPPEWRCPVVKWHRPRPHGRDRHHIWPMYLGGPESQPLVGICPSCHRDVHILLELARDNGWVLDEAHYRTYARRIVELAQLGADAINAHMLPVLPDWAAGTAEGR